MTETIGVVVLALGFAITLPAFVFAAFLVFRGRKSTRPSVTIYRRARFADSAPPVRDRH